MHKSIRISGFALDKLFTCNISLFSLSKILVHIGMDIPTFFEQIESGELHSLEDADSLTSIEYFTNREIAEALTSLGLDRTNSTLRLLRRDNGQSLRPETLRHLCELAEIPIGELFRIIHTKRITGESQYTDSTARTAFRNRPLSASSEAISGTVLYALYLITRLLIPVKDGVVDSYFLGSMLKGWNPKLEGLYKVLFPLGIEIVDFLEAIEKDDLILRPSRNFKGNTYISHVLVSIIWKEYQNKDISKRGISRLLTVSPSSVFRIINTENLDIRLGTLIKYEGPLEMPLSYIFREYDRLYN